MEDKRVLFLSLDMTLEHFKNIKKNHQKTFYLIAQ